MCGITGIFRKGAIKSAEIQTLTGYVRHRGPDGSHHWLNADSSVALGHTRLSILDLSEAADQPMASEDGRFVIVYNGEVYNYKELAEELRAAGYVFRSTSDTEVILAAYLTWGEAALSRFNGMWAFAIYDTAESSLFLARDRYGVKPLYYYVDDGQLVFSSEIQAIGKLTGPKNAVNLDFFARLIGFDLSAYSEEDTYLHGVSALLPGTLCHISRNLAIHKRQWYRLNRVCVPNTLPEQAAGLRELLTDACRIRLRSDVPVATCLSGGIDSGAIVSLLSLLSEESKDDIQSFSHRSFTAAFPGSQMDETNAAQSLAAAKGMHLNLHTVECPSPELLEKALAACDGPMPSLAFYPIWKLYQHIKESGISVTLDGQGADEMLGGYYLGYQAMKGAWQSRRPLWCWDLFRTYRSLDSTATTRIRKDLRAVLGEGRQEIGQHLKRPLKKLLGAVGLYSTKPSKLREAVPNPAAVSASDPDSGNELAHALWNQFFVGPLPYLLHQYDRCSMASGVECRMPFMDYRVVEYVFSLPLRSRIGGGYTKRVLREAVKGILPEETRVKRQKMGFNAPFSEWICGPLHEWTQDLMSSQAFGESIYFDGNLFRRQFRTSTDANLKHLAESILWPCLHATWWKLNRSQSS